MRIVIDTNIIVSAIYFGGQPTRLLTLLMENRVEAVVNDEIVEEYRDTLQKLHNKYPTLSTNIPFVEIVSRFEIIEVSSNIQVCRDPDDDKFISCAVDGKCVYIVSGDRDLLTIEKYQDVEILTVAEFFQRYPYLL